MYLCHGGDGQRSTRQSGTQIADTQAARLAPQTVGQESNKMFGLGVPTVVRPQLNPGQPERRQVACSIPKAKSAWHCLLRESVG